MPIIDPFTLPKGTIGDSEEFTITLAETIAAIVAYAKIVRKHAENPLPGGDSIASLLSAALKDPRADEFMAGAMCAAVALCESVSNQDMAVALCNMPRIGEYVLSHQEPTPPSSTDPNLH